MKPPALFRPWLMPNPNAPGRSPSFTQSPPRQRASAGSLVMLLNSPRPLPMLRFACLLAMIILTSGSVQAQAKKGAKSADFYRRAECYRELGYTRAQARKPTKAAIEEVDQCLARRRADPAAAPQAEPED
jgi:hypothetical protein